MWKQGESFGFWRHNPFGFVWLIGKQETPKQNLWILALCHSALFSWWGKQEKARHKVRILALMVCSCCSFRNFLVLIVASCIRNFQGIFYKLSLSSMCEISFFLFFMFSFFNDPDSDLPLISCVYWGMVIFPAHTSKALSSLMSINPSRLSPNDAPLSTQTKLCPFEERSLVWTYRVLVFSVHTWVQIIYILYYFLNVIALRNWILKVQQRAKESSLEENTESCNIPLSILWYSHGVLILEVVDGC